MSDWPAWATETVEIVPPDPTWAARGEAERGELAELLGRHVAGEIHHFGSTAVPGLAAKPILDLIADVADLAHADEIAAILAPRGWRYVPPDIDQRPRQRFFVKVIDGRRVAHLHLMRLGDRRAADKLRFRDLLRADSDLRRRYALLKRRLEAEHSDDREAYTAAKSVFVREALEPL